MQELSLGAAYFSLYKINKHPTVFKRKKGAWGNSGHLP